MAMSGREQVSSMVSQGSTSMAEQPSQDSGIECLLLWAMDALKTDKDRLRVFN
jgi:hypothetical protein